MTSREARSGFALPATLAVLGVTTLVFLVAITALASLTAEARSARDRVRFLQQAMTAEATLAYLASTEPLRPQGFAVGAGRILDEFSRQPGAAPATSGLEAAEVRLDGRTYLMDVDGPVTAALQDQAGLLNLAFLDDAAWMRLLGEVGVAPREAQRLTARYRDYVDADDLRRVDGAEARDYPRHGPANRALLRPTELLSVLGARDAFRPGAWRAVRDDLATDISAPAVNVNTATPRTLRVLFDLTPAQAEAAVAARRDAPFLSLADLAAAAGAPILDPVERIFTFPSGRVQVTLRDARSAWVYRSRLTLTPSGLEQPVWIDQTELSEAPRRARADTSNAARLPYAPR